MGTELVPLGSPTACYPNIGNRAIADRQPPLFAICMMLPIPTKSATITFLAVIRKWARNMRSLTISISFVKLALLAFLALLFIVMKTSIANAIKPKYVNFNQNLPLINLAQELESKSSYLKREMIEAISSDKVFRSKFPEGMNTFDPFEPHWNCPFEIRVGKRFGDGGKFVCGHRSFFSVTQSCLVYSVGSNMDFSFETAFKEEFGFDCEIHTFDPTVDAIQAKAVAASSNVTFHPWGLSSSDNGNMLTIFTIMKKLNHIGRRIDVLKVDCEGCEFESFKSIFLESKKETINVGQIQVELHMPEDRYQVVSFFLDAIDSGFDIFHKERNHWGCGGWSCVEFSLIHKDIKRLVYETTFGLHSKQQV
jgi:hypothetical protein